MQYPLNMFNVKEEIVYDGHATHIEKLQQSFIRTALNLIQKYFQKLQFKIQNVITYLRRYIKDT